MTTIPAGAPYTLRAEWREHEGGPAALVTGVTVTITQLSDVTVIVGPTATGVVHVATGLDVYSWAVAADASGDYAVVFDGLDDSAEAVQTEAEIITVGAADFTADPATTTGMIRLLIPDTDPAGPIFTDTQIGAFYVFEGSNVRLATAQALEAIASNEAMVSKVLKTLDLETNGDKVAASLLARAKILRSTAADYDSAGNLFGMAVVDWRNPDGRFGHELAEAGLC